MGNRATGLKSRTSRSGGGLLSPQVMATRQRPRRRASPARVRTVLATPLTSVRVSVNQAFLPPDRDGRRGAASVSESVQVPAPAAPAPAPAPVPAAAPAPSGNPRAVAGWRSP